jgi:hypothetical protein
LVTRFFGNLLTAKEAFGAIRRASSATPVQVDPPTYCCNLFDRLDRRSNAINSGNIWNFLHDHMAKHYAVELGLTATGADITQ